MTTPRILFCAYDRPGYVAGGPNTWLRRLLPDLREAGFDIRPVIIHAGAVAECPLIRFLEEKEFEVSVFSRSESPYVEDQVRWLLRQARSIRPSVFVANLVCQAFYCTPWLRKAGIPTVGVIHSDDDFYRAVARRFVSGDRQHHLSAVVAVSALLADSIAEKNPHRVPIDRIPCGASVEPKRYAEIPDANHTSRLRLVYLGRIAEKQKRIFDTARAMSRAARKIPGVSARIYGSGPEETALRDLIETEDLAVKYAGPVSPDDVSLVLSQHDVFVLLSDYEGLPIALIEAMAEGLAPVCLAERSGVAEVLVHRKNGLIVEDREQSFLDAIRELKEDPGWREDLARESHHTVLQEYSSAVNHRRWADLLTALGNESSPKTVPVPRFLHLPAPEPAFGGEDRRRPPLTERISRSTRRCWFETRQRVRPRARLRAILGGAGKAD